MGSPQTSVGVAVRMLDRSIRRCMRLSAPQSEDEITPENMLILFFLDEMESSGHTVVQKDIEKNLGITRSTMSRILTLMESKGLIERSRVDGDARLKGVSLTDKSRAIVSGANRSGIRVDKQLTEGFSAEEIATFMSFLSRMQANIDGAIGDAGGITPMQEKNELVQEHIAIDRLSRARGTQGAKMLSPAKAPPITPRNVTDTQAESSEVTADTMKEKK